MKKSVICYGLGRDFGADDASIHAKYDVIGYCDRNEGRAKKTWGRKGDLTRPS